MRIFLAFVAYLAACMLLSALLIPWLQPLFAAWFGATPDRSLYRLGMLLAALGLPLLLHALRLSDKPSMGWIAPPGGIPRALHVGLGIGVLMLSLVILVLLLLGVRYLEPQRLTSSRLLSAAISGLASGLAVGLIEEFFFRGPLQGGLRRCRPIWLSAPLIGLFYATVHFIRPVPLEGQVLDISSSLGMLAGGLAELSDFPKYADSFVTLTLAGIFLSLTRERTGSLFLAIGAHAGWVMVIRMAKATTGTNHSSPWIWTIGDYDNVTGWLACLIIGASSVFYWLATRGKRIRQTG